MGQLRTAKAADLGAFPGSTFVVEDTPPITQCQETSILKFDGTIVNGLKTITEIGAFTGYDLAGKKVEVLAPFGQEGNYNVISNTDDVLLTDHIFTASVDTADYRVTDPGQAYLTRNESSFTRFVENEGQAHTTKGGQLFTDTPSPPLNAACSDTFDPQ